MRGRNLTFFGPGVPKISNEVGVGVGVDAKSMLYGTSFMKAMAGHRHGKGYPRWAGN